MKRFLFLLFIALAIPLTSFEIRHYPTASIQPIEETVYVTKTGEKYHRANCGYLRQSKRAISLSDAKAAGYTPCSRCKPPQ